MRLCQAGIFPLHPLSLQILTAKAISLWPKILASQQKNLQVSNTPFYTNKKVMKTFLNFPYTWESKDHCQSLWTPNRETHWTWATFPLHAKQDGGLCRDLIYSLAVGKAGSLTFIVTLTALGGGANQLLMEPWKKWVGFFFIKPRLNKTSAGNEILGWRENPLSDCSVTK